METVGVFIAFVLLMAVVYLVLRPFIVPEEIAEDDLETIQLDIQKDRIIEAIREIDMDYQTGKLSDEDYNLLRSRYTAAAGEVIRRIDSDAAANRQQDAAPAGDGDANAQGDEQVEEHVEDKSRNSSKTSSTTSWNGR